MSVLALVACILDGIGDAGIWVTLRCIAWRDHLVPLDPIPPDVEARITANVMAAVAPPAVIKDPGQVAEKLISSIYRPTVRDLWLAGETAQSGMPLMFVETTEGGQAVFQKRIGKAKPS